MKKKMEKDTNKKKKKKRERKVLNYKVVFPWQMSAYEQIERKRGASWKCLAYCRIIRWTIYIFFSSTSSFFFSPYLFVYLLITSDENSFFSLGPLPEVLVCFTTALHSTVDHYLTVIRLTIPLTSARSPAGWLAVVDAMMDFLHLF